MGQQKGAPTPSDDEPQRSFTERTGRGNKPRLLYDDGHGGRVKLWTNEGKNGPFETIGIENGFYDKDDKWVEQRVNLNANQVLAVSRSLEKGHDLIMQAMIDRAEQKGQSR